MELIYQQLLRHLWVTPILAGVTTWYCFQVDYTLELRALVTIFFAGIFFAFAITMNTANLRRFQALEDIAHIKSILLSVWQTAKLHLDHEQQAAFKIQIHGFFDTLQDFFHRPDTSTATAEQLETVDNFFDYLATHCQNLRDLGMPSPEVSRVMQWRQQGYHAFERLLTIKENRSPLALRFFMSFALIISLFVLAPQFAAFGYFGIGAVVIISIIMVSLIRIQNDLELPFGADLDDISFEFGERFKQRVQ